MFNIIMIRAFCVVLLLTALMCFVTYYGYFAKAKVELGQDHYAERMIPAWKPYLPKWFKMPFNTCVNVGYVIFGAAWCAIVSVALINKHLSMTDAFCFYFFNFASCVYGPIQALRILTQMHGFGVMDQWYTLPFFMWVFIWGLYLKHGWNVWRAIFLLTASLVSYALVLHSEIGFEIALGMHITLAVIGGVVAWAAHSQAKAKKAFLGAMICCAGFVGLKLLDLELVKYHFIFQYVSGHFLSKIFDIFQIHFVNRFFFTITLAAIADKKKKKE